VRRRQNCPIMARQKGQSHRQSYVTVTHARRKGSDLIEAWPSISPAPPSDLGAQPERCQLPARAPAELFRDGLVPFDNVNIRF